MSTWKDNEMEELFMIGADAGVDVNKFRILCFFSEFVPSGEMKWVGEVVCKCTW